MTYQTSIGTLISNISFLKIRIKFNEPPFKRLILDPLNKHEDKKSEDINNRQEYEEEKGPFNSDNKDIDQLKTIMLNSGLQIQDRSE